MSRPQSGDKLGRRFAVVAAFALIALSTPGRSWAQDSQSHPLDTVLKALDLKTDVDRPAGFVEESRPKADPGFVPVGAPHPDRSIKVKSPAELKAAEAELDAARVQHDKISGRKPPADPAVPKARPVKQRAATQN